MRTPRQILRGERNCVHCREPAIGWANGNDVCRHHRSMERTFNGERKRGYRGHHAMPDDVRQKYERRLNRRGDQAE